MGRLRKKPWIGQALEEYRDIVLMGQDLQEYQGRWYEKLPTGGMLQVEVGTGKGGFLAGMAQRFPEHCFVGLEKEQDILYHAAKKIRELQLKNVKLVLADVKQLADVFLAGEIDRLFVNFCDPWPKNRHAKRRLTHIEFLKQYQAVMKCDGIIRLKTDNQYLFDSSLEQFEIAKMDVFELSRDYHQEFKKCDILTEYEEKFQSAGMPIYCCFAKFPVLVCKEDSN